MVIDYQTNRRIDRHLKYLSCGELKPLLTKWYRCNGSEWTIERLKTLKVQLLQLLAGKKPIKNWVSYKRGFPKGIIGSLFREALTSRQKEKRALSILNVYLSFMNPSNSKINNCIQTIAKPGSVDSRTKAFELSLEIELWGPDMRRAREWAKHCKPEFSFAGLNTSKPGIVNKELNQWVQSMDYTSHLSLPTSSLTRDTIPKVFSGGQVDVAGSLIPLKERGNKVRIIAMPHAEIQVALKPLHGYLNRVLKSLKEDCTYNQVSGADWVITQFTEGKTVYSVDLSSATDRFPLTLQIALLRKLMENNHERWASCFLATSNLPWYFRGTFVRYGEGQPMGLYGSFALFALTHHALLHTLCKSLGFDPSYRPYRILGDDIVLSDDQLAKKYIDTIKQLGVQISESKSFVSNNLAEFAGFIIRHDEYYKPAKVPKGVPTADNVIHYLDSVGHNPFPKTHKFYEVAELLLQYPQPEGLGKNPNGIPLRERFHWKDLSEDENRALKVDLLPTLLSSLFGRNTYTDNRDLPSEYLDKIPRYLRNSNRTIDMIYDEVLQNRQELKDENVVLYGFDHRISGSLSSSSKSDYGALGKLGDHQSNEIDVSKFKRMFPYYPWSG